MWAIFKREFKNFFQNVIGWVFIASMVFVSALYFNAYNINAGMSDILYVLVRLLMIMIFSLPVLSMRILSEEKKNKTDQLTLTAPISVGKIIIGKYLVLVVVKKKDVQLLAHLLVRPKSYFATNQQPHLIQKTQKTLSHF